MLKKVLDTNLNFIKNNIKTLTTKQLQKNNLPKSITKINKDILNSIKIDLEKNKKNYNMIGQNYTNSYLPLISKLILKEKKIFLEKILKNPKNFQGTLEIIFNLQNLIKKILKIENVTFLTEPSNAILQAMILSYNFHNKKKKIFFVSKKIFENQIEILKNFGEREKIKIIFFEKITEEKINNFENEICGIIFQSPDKYGILEKEKKRFYTFLKKKKICFILSVDIFNSLYNKPPREYSDCGADIVCGSLQKLGIPISYHGGTNCFLGAKTQYLPFFKTFRVIQKKKIKNKKLNNIFDNDYSIEYDFYCQNPLNIQFCPHMVKLNYFFLIQTGEKNLLKIIYEIQQMTEILKNILIKKKTMLISNKKKRNYFDTIAVVNIKKPYLNYYSLPDENIATITLDYSHYAKTCDTARNKGAYNYKISHTFGKVYSVFTQFIPKKVFDYYIPFKYFFFGFEIE